jgi:hypothetical protein
VVQLSVVNMSFSAYTLTGSPAFTNAFIGAGSLGLAYFASATFSGTGTGKRYDVSQNAMIHTAGGGASFFPGSTTGTATTGGIYA